MQALPGSVLDLRSPSRFAHGWLPDQAFAGGAMCAVIDDLRHPARGNAGHVELLRRLEDRLRRPGSGSAFVLVPPDADHHLVGPIVCAVDASSGARRALGLARELARDVDAPLVLAHAIPFADENAVGDRGACRAVEVRRRRASLHRVTSNVRRVVGGHPIDVLRGPARAQLRLTEFARERNARLLIIGSGTAAAESWLSREASCPVVVLSPAFAAETPTPRHSR